MLKISLLILSLSTVCHVQLQGRQTFPFGDFNGMYKSIKRSIKMRYKSPENSVPVFLVDMGQRKIFRERTTYRRKSKISQTSVKKKTKLKLDLSSLSKMLYSKKTKGNKQQPIIFVTSQSSPKLGISIASSQKNSPVIHTSHVVSKFSKIYLPPKAKESFKTMFLLNKGRKYDDDSNTTILTFHLTKHHRYQTIKNIKLNLRLLKNTRLVSSYITDQRDTFKHALKKSLPVFDASTKWVTLDFTDDVLKIMKMYQHVNRFHLYIILNSDSERISKEIESSYISVDLTRHISRKRRKREKLEICGVRNIFVKFDDMKLKMVYPFTLFRLAGIHVSYCTGTCDQKIANDRKTFQQLFHDQSKSKKCCVATKVHKTVSPIYHNTKSIGGQQLNSRECECR